MSSSGSSNTRSYHGHAADNNCHRNLEAMLPHNLYNSGSSTNINDDSERSSATCISPSSSRGMAISETHPTNLVGGDNSRIPFLPHEIMMSSRSPLGSSSNDEVAGTRVRTGLQFSAEAPGGRFNARDASLTDEEREILIDQVFNLMQMDDQFLPEDNIPTDPYVSRYGESRDIYRDMRLDIDSMSYEELLTLEENIGNVNSGVSRTKIRGSMRQWKYAVPDLKLCCICQEDYAAGDDAGKLDCGHEFHTGCIERWLVLKNVCPICKVTAIGT
ncbi:RING/U-box superfamily protein [Striga asiatica]|uniref:RING-type E3 ubiquitin transferase n=1 Tax=Striga asiatica TaxID=4170 RepID=A0A5A7QIB5_STRAF|nr:RING/U-box superfamily protein [Striga asiatica]